MHLALDGQEALTKWAELGESLRAIYLDLLFPNASGATVRIRVREQRPYFPVVLASGFDEGTILPAVTGRARTDTALMKSEA